jgi:hypothetical protein
VRVANEPSIPAGELESGRTSLRPFLWLCVAVTAAWFVTTLLICCAFPNWDTRGTVGDTFGAVNALFSGLALAGIIYALMLQRTELRLQRQEPALARNLLAAQLAEMRSSRELQAQPLALPSVRSVKIERPRFWCTSLERGCSAHSRYFVSVGIENPTQYPCVAVNISIVLSIPKPGTPEFLGAPDEILECIAPQSRIEESQGPRFTFATDTYGRFLDALGQSDSRATPSITITILYENLLGAQFRVVQHFRVCTSSDTEAALRQWHAAIAEFEPAFERQLAELRAAHAPGDEQKSPLFETLAQKLEQRLANDAIEIVLTANAVPATFKVRRITEQMGRSFT